MAIDDIVARILADAEAEAAAIVAEAADDAGRVTGAARERAEADAARTLARESAAARRDAETLLANARLKARDAMLTARLELDGKVLSAAEAALIALPDESYAEWIARGIASTSAGDEVVHVGTLDTSRLSALLPAALASAGAPLSVSDTPAAIERGVDLVSDRVRVEVSPAAMVASRRAALLAEADRLLFGREA